MKRYIRRALKYLVWIVVLFSIIFLIMNLTGTSTIKGIDGLVNMMGTSKGNMLLLVVFGLSALYPLVGFSSREIPGSLEANRKLIVDEMQRAGFVCDRIENGVMHFKACRFAKKLAMLFEDDIEISSREGVIVIEGIRREIVKIEYRLLPLLISKES